MKHLTLYSRRWSAARGWHWKVERAVAEATKDGWLAVFRRDEPSVEFTVADKPPKEPK